MKKKKKKKIKREIKQHLIAISYIICIFVVAILVTLIRSFL